MHSEVDVAPCQEFPGLLLALVKLFSAHLALAVLLSQGGTHTPSEYMLPEYRFVVGISKFRRKFNMPLTGALLNSVAM